MPIDPDLRQAGLSRFLSAAGRVIKSLWELPGRLVFGNHNVITGEVFNDAFGIRPSHLAMTLKEAQKHINETNVNMPAGENWVRPLHAAILACADLGAEGPKIVEWIFEKGATVEATDRRGRTALHFAGTPEAAALLLKHNASVHAVDEQERTPLHDVKNPAVAKLLLDAGANINARDREGRTPLHRAIKSKNWDKAELLILGGADVNALDQHGVSPIHVPNGIVPLNYKIDQGVLIPFSELDAGCLEQGEASRGMMKARQSVLADMGKRRQDYGRMAHIARLLVEKGARTDMGLSTDKTIDPDDSLAGLLKAYDEEARRVEEGNKPEQTMHGPSNPRHGNHNGALKGAEATGVSDPKPDDERVHERQPPSRFPRLEETDFFRKQESHVREKEITGPTTESGREIEQPDGKRARKTRSRKRGIDYER